MKTVTAGFRGRGRCAMEDAFAIESLRSQLEYSRSLYCRLRIAVVDYLEALPSDRDAYMRRMRHEVGRWKEGAR